MLLIAIQSFGQTSLDFNIAIENGKLANEGLKRCNLYMYGWLNQADALTGLIPRTVTGDNYWNAKDAAADNYPFMVLSAFFTDTPSFNGVMIDILNKEIALTSRIGSMPDTYDFTTQSLQENSLSSVIFGSSEYIKDGLLPLTEWLGPSPWSDRMLSIINDIWIYAEINTEFGKIPSTDFEVAGELLQSLSRIYWMTGEQKYLDWAIRLGDYFLLGNNHPTDDATTLRLRDHGNEIIAGLTELYATIAYTDAVKKQSYEIPIHKMLDKILEIGRNDDGLLYNEIYPQTGTHSSGLSDTWGYVLNAHYTVYLIDSTQEYRDAILKALTSLGNSYYTDTHRFGEVMDGYADAIESALNLYNRELIIPAEVYMDKSIRRMWDLQQPSGIIEGWYGDGNFARTSIMYCLWKTQGLTIQNWDEDVILGAVLNNTYYTPEIADMYVNSTNRYDIFKNGTNVGTLIYTDRNYSITKIPDYLLAETIIRTACDDKKVNIDEFITFTALEDIIVYLAVDKRVTQVPNWIKEKDWKLTGDEIVTSLDNLQFDLYSKYTTGGTIISLGGPQAEGFQGYSESGNYLVFIKNVNQTDTLTPNIKDTLKVALLSEKDWEGKLFFDIPRHKTYLNLPFNWTRINQFPEWYTVEKDSIYTIHNLTSDTKKEYTGYELSHGILISLEKDIEQYLAITPYIEIQEPSGIKELGDNPAKLNSVPFKLIIENTQLVIDFNITDTYNTVNIYDIKGNLQWRRSNIVSETITWPITRKNEVYIVQVISDDGIFTKKIVILP